MKNALVFLIMALMLFVSSSYTEHPDNFAVASNESEAYYMIDVEEYLYDKVKPIMETWNEDGIYAISFFVYSNEMYTYYCA